MAERRINLKAQAVAVPAPVHETAIFRSALAPAGLVTTWDERVKTLFDSFQVTLGRVPKKDFLGTLINVNGKQTFQWQTYEAVWERIQNLGSGLVGLGLQPGDRVGIYMQNQAEWVISEHACYAYSFVPVALYDTLGADAVNFVIDHAEIGTVICNEKTKANVLKIEAKSLRQLVVVGGVAPAPAAAAAPAPEPAASAAEGSAVADSAKEEAKAPAPTPSPSSLQITSLQETEALGQQKRVEPRPPAPNDLATIMYTSGTTGNPKGVMLPHLAFVAEVAGGRLHMGDLLEEKSVHMSYLPLAHSFERSIHAILTSLGASIGFFTGNIVTLFDEIAILRPTFLAGAPRVWQRLQQRVLGQVEKAGFLKKLLFKKALAMKQDYLKEGEDSTPILDSLVFDQTKNKLGGRVRFIFSGAAPLDSELARFLKACFCCPIMQGYGLTETCAGSVITNFHDNTVGHVGAPLPCNEIKLESVPEMNYHASDRKGEILIRGPNVFTGYFKDPQKTAEDLGEDGWFHTGDIGYITDAGCLSIIDRKKNIFKLSQGEYVAAEYLESVYSRAFPVGQIFVYGDSFHAFLVAVIVPNFELLQGPAQDKGLKGPAQEHLNHPAVLQVVKEALDAEGKKAKLHGFEFLKAFHLDPNPFTIENGLLTPSFKPRRPDLKNHYKAELDRMYAQEPR